MRKIVTLALMMTVVCACGSTHSQIDVRGKGRIYVGMSNDKLSEVMGEPDSVGRGKYGCHHDANFFGFTPGEQTIEWAWERPDGSTVVAYLDDGAVVELGVVEPETKSVE